MNKHPSFRLATATMFWAGAVFLSGCADMPIGPTVAVMPGPNKPFEVFVQEDQLCRAWAAQSIGSGDAASQRMLASTVTGTVIGAVAGTVLGGDSNAAAAGAAMGTLVGAGAGVNQGAMTAWTAQRRYDIAYQQCMYSKGNLVQAFTDGSRRIPVLALPAPPPPPGPR